MIWVKLLATGKWLVKYSFENKDTRLTWAPLCVFLLVFQGDDESLMPYITSCSIACGFHAGDPVVMQKTIKLALKHGVRIGAHPSFLDLQGFGRREMKMDSHECEMMVIYQIGALKAFLDIEGVPLSHISVRTFLLL